MLRQALGAPSRIVRCSAHAAGRRWPAPAAQLRPIALPAVCRPARTASSVRWSSSEAGTSDKAAPEAPAKEPEAAPAEAASTEAESTPNKELEAKTKEALEWKDKYLRSVADFRNLQSRTEREVKAARDFAIQKFARDLVDSVDNLERALLTVPEDKLKTGSETDQKPEHLQDLVNLYEGLKMTENILVKTLAKHGLERFDPMGDKFNPVEHEACRIDSKPDMENNTVYITQQTGFKLNGRILRPAKVGVVKNS